VKKNIISGSAAILFGLLIAVGPQLIFSFYDDHGKVTSFCHWVAQAETCMGILLSALGICLILFSDIKIQLGLTIGIFLAGIVALLIPHDLFFGVCKETSASCNKITFPALMIINSVLIIGAVFNMIYLEKKTRS